MGYKGDSRVTIYPIPLKICTNPRIMRYMCQKDMEKISLRSTKSRKKRHSRDHLVENVQEIETDLFNLTSIFKKIKVYKQFIQYDSKSL